MGEAMIASYKIILFSLFSLLVVACEQAQDTSEKPILRLVRTLKVTPTNASPWREYSGVVEAERSAVMSFRVAGKIESMAVREGSLVTEGQLLAQLDDTDYRIQQKSRQAEFDKAAADFRRAKQLIKTGAISQSDFEQLKTQRESASAMLESAKQNVKYTSLTAPFSGRIAKSHVENFEEVQAKQSIFTLQDPKALLIKVDVPESVMILANETTNPELQAVFSQFPQRKFPLQIAKLSTLADPQTSTYSVRLSMPPVDDLNVLPGMSVTVLAKPSPGQSPRESNIYLPAHAVLEDSDGRFVYTVQRQANGNGLIARRAVEVGALSNAGLAILGGLQEGEEVVVAGMSKMAEGLEVRLAAERQQ